MSRKLIFPACLILALGVINAANGNLVGWWKLDETSGTVAHDSSGYGNDGILYGDPQWTGGALEFDGDGDYVDCGQGETLNITGEVTVAAWIKLTGPASDRKIAGNQDGITGGYKFGVYSDLLEFEIRTADNSAVLNRSVSGGTILEQDMYYHIAGVYSQGNYIRTYVNGVLDRELSTADVLGTSTGTFKIGRESFSDSYFWLGLMDDVRVYNRALTQEEILDLAQAEASLFASNPSPADGAIYEDTWATLTWTSGTNAVSHDVYFGDDFDAVNDGTGDTFQGNQTSTIFILGFPGFPYPDGLVPGTTYYWRIDEVNEANPDSPWKGDVWRFTIPPKTAYSPYPPDGARFVEPTVILTWTAGLNAKLHTVYFGDNFEAVDNAVGGPTQAITAYNPGPLELDKTYYWRVDQFDGLYTYKGDVWSFTPGRGLAGRILWEWWLDISGTAVDALTSDPRYPAEPDGSEHLTLFEGPVNWADNYGSRLSGWLSPPESGNYTFWIASDDASELWLSTDEDPTNKQLIASLSGWVTPRDFDNVAGSGGDNMMSEPQSLLQGKLYYIEAVMKEGSGDDNVAVAWQAPSGDREVIPGRFVYSYVLPKHEAVNIATKFADLIDVNSVILSWEDSTNSHTFKVRGKDDKGDLLIGIDAFTGEVVKFVKQCPYPGRDSDIVRISRQGAIDRCLSFLSDNELPEIPADYMQVEPLRLTTWTIEQWRIDYLHYVDDVQVASDFILFLVNADNGEISAYSKVSHRVAMPTKPVLVEEEAIALASGVLMDLTGHADPEFLSISLKILYPNNYFFDLIYHFSERQALAWVIQFGQGGEPDVDVWIDAITGALLGGEIYERPVPELYGIGNQYTDVTQIWEPALDAMQYNTVHTVLGSTTVTDVAQSIQNSDYFILQAHGNTNISALNSTYLHPGDIPNNNLRYALVSSCRSGVKTSGTDFWEAFVDGGTDVFQGYADISNPDYYEMALREYLAVGDSLWNAHQNAITDSGYSKTVTIEFGPPLYCFNMLRLAPLLVKATGSVQGQTITIQAEVSNLETARKSAATNVSANLVAPAGFSITGTNPKTTASLSWANTWTTQWTIQVPAGAWGAKTFDVIVTSDNLGVAVDDFALATAASPQYHPVTVMLYP